MLFEFRPVPKPNFEKKKKVKEKPWKKKPKEKRTPKAAIIGTERQGVKPPPRSKRNEFTARQRKLALSWFGTRCNIPNCPHAATELHHVIYRSQSGRGVWRNAIPLCLKHHDQAHDFKDFRKALEAMRIELFGEHFYKDKWDLWLDGLIEDPTEAEMEAFMDREG